MVEPLQAGAASVEITPRNPLFLWGYPHVARTSTGVHDPLLSSALYVTDGAKKVLFVANDVIFVPKAVADRARRRIGGATGVPVEGIMVTATHTHSGPATVRYLSNEADPVVPPPDPAFPRQLEDGIVAAAEEAVAKAAPAEVGLVIADGSGVGTNRRDPSGPRDPDVPVLVVRPAGGGPAVAVMWVCCMHPTVLHEDSTLVSGDFPAFTRSYLQSAVGEACVMLHHMGPSGNQSPRHVVRAQTFAEARRLGEWLGGSILAAMEGAVYSPAAGLECRRASVDLPVRSFPSETEAQARLDLAAWRLDSLRQAGAPPARVRTAECDWFGAEETRALARAAAEGRVREYADACLPAEVQLLRIGRWSFVGWPGEVYVEFGLEVRRRHPDAFVITLANGELQGYLVTAEAVAEGGYEASNALFASPESARRLVETSDILLTSS